MHERGRPGAASRGDFLLDRPDEPHGGPLLVSATSPIPCTASTGHRMPTACPGQPPAINGFTTATPQQMLAEIKKAAKVTVAGPVSGPGWTGTRYAFSKTYAQRRRRNSNSGVPWMWTSKDEPGHSS